MLSARQEERLAMVVSVNSAIGNIFLSLGKVAVGLMAHSTAMISDGIHSASDVFGSLIVMVGVKLSHRASDKEHQYGHERLECITALILAIILGLVALGIGFTAAQKIFGGAGDLEVPGALALWAAAASVLVKEAMFWYTRAAAKKINSGALLAEAWHHRSDALSSVGSFIGILGARLGYPILDPLAGLVICFMILYAAYEVFADAVNKMVDRSVDAATDAALEDLVRKVPGVEHLDSLTSRIFGNRIYVDVEISVKDSLPLCAAHNIAETVHAAIEANFPLVKHCMVHVNPLSERSHECHMSLPAELLPRAAEKKA